MQNKKIVYIIGVTVLVGVLVGLFFAVSNQDSDVENNKLKVAATIFPLYDIVSNVAGDSVDVELLLPPGASPHFYEFTPRQLAGLSGTETIFAIGHGLDDWALKAAEAIEGVGIVVVDKGIELRENTEDEHGDEEEHEEDEHGDEHEHEHEHEEHGPIDPHYWLHFGNARAIADTVAEELSRIDSANAETYRANAEAYKAVLLAEEQLLKERIAPLATKELLTFHDSWYYFADNFGLNIVGTFEPSAGREPTPRYLSDLRDKVQEHSVSVIFSEPQYSNAAFNPFVNDNNLGFAVLDPIGGTNEISSFVELMRYNVNTALEALE